MAVRFFDMFAGIGGFRSGLTAARGFECVGWCEIDKYARQAYEAMYDTKGEIFFEDARTIDPERLLPALFPGIRETVSIRRTELSQH